MSCEHICLQYAADMLYVTDLCGASAVTMHIISWRHTISFTTVRSSAAVQDANLIQLGWRWVLVYAYVTTCICKCSRNCIWHSFIMYTPSVTITVTAKTLTAVICQSDKLCLGLGQQPAG